ncbi:MAG: ribonuclease H-like domain-containing protein [Lachnospiraceae bacterium]|nr:ribonuclease H-like domain-containing protein [Lachnospiraceae bacterium]
MKTLNYNFKQLKIEYDLSSITNPQKALFVDIETTGLSPRTASIYLIGVCFYQNNNWNAIQWFAQNLEDEADIIHAFFAFAADYSTLIHFNGNQFDLPFIKNRCELLGLNYSFEAFEGIDIYKRVSLCKHFLQLPNCKQTSIEKFLHIHREDKYNGGELIQLYQEYTKNPTTKIETLLLLHNKEDLEGMLKILPILSYGDIFNKPVRTTKVQANHYRDLNGKKQQELILRLKLINAVPIPISFHANDCYITIEGDHAALRVPVYTEELKYFYTNYKEYYYLPMEDIAMHKSVATFVDKEHRIPATAATCYTRKYSSYLPMWDYILEPFFKREYKSSLLFYELTDEFKTNREAFSKYASHILEMLGKSY